MPFWDTFSRMFNGEDYDEMTGQGCDTYDTMSSLDLHDLPKAFLISTKLSDDELHWLHQITSETGLPLTVDVEQAEWFLAKFQSSRRALHELRCRNIFLDAVEQTSLLECTSREPSSAKQEHLSSLETSSTTDSNLSTKACDSAARDELSSLDLETFGTRTLLSELQSSSITCVVHVDWLQNSIQSNKCLPLWPHVITFGRFNDTVKSRPGRSPPAEPIDPDQPIVSTTEAGFLHADAGILERAKEVLSQASADNEPKSFRLLGTRQQPRPPRRALGQQGAVSRPSALTRVSTSEFDAAAEAVPQVLPKWVEQGKIYSCERATPLVCANQEFVDLLGKIRLCRELTEDEVGVRAYSSSMAAVAAFDRPLTSISEVLKLPGCNLKIAQLFREWKSTGRIRAAEDIEKDETLKVINDFHEIWGVGVKTARSFFDLGWRDRDDVVEFGWETLKPNQQVGVKYFDEFQSPVSRSEIESIAEIIVNHARRVRDNGVQHCLVGGYRRGKELCHDVDIILSHPDLAQTSGLILDVVDSLSTEGWVTHTLMLSTRSSDRDQQPHPLRGNFTRGSFSDTLDKALVVWQDIHFSGEKNTNIHRRVDIIISPWPFAGCAVLGWSGGTTYERDLRRFAKTKHGWRFDSSGIRDRSTGTVIALDPSAETMEQSERLVLEKLGLPYLEPSQRCAH